MKLNKVSSYNYSLIWDGIKLLLVITNSAVDLVRKKGNLLLVQNL